MPNESQTPLVEREWWDKHLCQEESPRIIPSYKIPALLAEHKERIKKEIEGIRRPIKEYKFAEECSYCEDYLGGYCGGCREFNAILNEVLNLECLK